MDEGVLEELGLSKGETRIYLVLLGIGSTTATAIITKSGFHKGTTYAILERLIEKGLVSYITKGKKKYFKAMDPNRLLDIAKEKEEHIKNILPELLNLEKKAKKEQPETEIYMGKKAYKNLIEEQIGSKELYSIGMTTKAWKILKYTMPLLVKKAIKVNLKFNIIADEETKSMFSKFSKWPNVRIKYLPKGYSSPSATMIWKNKISISVLEDKNQPFVAIIKSKKVNDAYKKYFNLLWKIAKS